MNRHLTLIAEVVSKLDAEVVALVRLPYPGRPVYIVAWRTVVGTGFHYGTHRAYEELDGQSFGLESGMYLMGCSMEEAVEDMMSRTPFAPVDA